MEIGRKVEAQDLRNYIFQKAAYSVEIPPAPLDKGGGVSRGDPSKALMRNKCVSPELYVQLQLTGEGWEMLGAIAAAARSLAISKSSGRW